MPAHSRRDIAVWPHKAAGRLFFYLIPVLVLGLGCTRAHASAFQLTEQNASGLGNGYAGSAAIAENASTIYFNPAGRSEEHTSELQSLMRISYAVFCLKKKNTHTDRKQD